MVTAAVIGFVCVGWAGFITVAFIYMHKLKKADEEQNISKEIVDLVVLQDGSDESKRKDGDEP